MDFPKLYVKITLRFSSKGHHIIFDISERKNMDDADDPNKARPFSIIQFL